MKLNHKGENKTYYEEETDSIDNKLELLKYMSKVLSRSLKEDVTPDFVMAKFNKEKDKEGIIEMTNNAYFCKRTLDMLTKRKIWQYNYVEHQWEQRKRTEEEKQEIHQATRKMFDTFMTRNTMTAILNRNVERNHILRLMAGLDTEEPQQTDQENEKTKTKIDELVEEFKKREKNNNGKEK